MKRGGYTVRAFDRGESLDYRDGEGQLWLQCGSTRVYCADTAKLPFSRRERILVNLCDYFEADQNPLIVVVEEDDPERKELESLVCRLSAGGQKLRIEYQSAEKREQFERDWELRWLRAGKKLKIEGTEIATEEDYLRWKDARNGDGPESGPAASQDNSSDGSASY